MQRLQSLKTKCKREVIELVKHIPPVKKGYVAPEFRVQPSTLRRPILQSGTMLQEEVLKVPHTHRG